MRTETLAIVFTDIKGYTAATSAQTHVQNARMLKSMASLVTPVVRAFDGRIVKSIGDAYMIVFRSPTDALRCALAVQDRLHQNNHGKAEDAGIHIRIAMNIGEVRVHRGDVFGEPVNIASRIESVTPADEVYLSESMYLTMNKSDLAIERVGEYELKGIPEPVTVYRAKRFADASADDSKEHVMPFGGKQIAQWQKNAWLQRANIAIWAFAIVGLCLAGYFRYRPENDYSATVQQVKDLVEKGDALGAVAKAGEIPAEAVQEKTLVRRYRRQAAQQLFESGQLDTAKGQVDSLLAEDQRDPDALLLRGLIAAKNDDLRTAFAALTEALRLNPSLTQRTDLSPIAARGYIDATTRKTADQFIETYLREQAIPALTRLMQTSQDRNVRVAAAMRLEKLGAREEVDWVALALEDLKSTSCKVKKSAIQRLITEGDERAVGPLLKLADNKNCVTELAKKAAAQIMGK